VREIGKWVESLIGSQINLICALLETASLGDVPWVVTRALIGISGVVLAAWAFRSGRPGQGSGGKLPGA